MSFFLSPTFNQPQISGLADLCFSLSKGMFLASLAAPALFREVNAITIINSVKMILGGLFFTLLALKFLELKEVS